MKTSHPRSSAVVRTKRSTPMFLTLNEVADRLGASKKTVRRRMADGSLRYHQIGGLIRVAEEDFNAFVAARRR